ncbi:MAG: Radical SAM superfamily enzyme [Candidatus Methanohalarchaeum thermophilum]|uniref:Radical SAM superfamily enzyme n=1 Tax=Methanohalarchaeum thermophilum TaxID=1903181 RepID=A0A1Q6DUI3_METT1|nr:MAG: Radical SAM superfamily enzyme [Candidatus Methanohalarchaeum thermophilum]
MKSYSVYNGLGFDISLEVENNEANMVSKGIFSPIIDYITEGFNQHASLDKVAKSDPERVYITSMVPAVPSKPFDRLVKNQLKRKFLKRRPLESLMLLTTNRCQCDCNHCIVHGMEGENELTTAEMKEIIDEAIDLGAYHISFEGGEPTLRDDIFELIDYVDKDKASTHLISNGYKLDRDFIDRLNEKNLNCLHVSLDSPYKKDHNEFRGLEVFEKASNAVKYAKESDMLTVVEYTANPSNSSIDHLRDIYKHCNEINVDELLIDEVVPGGKWEYKEENLLSKEDYQRISKFKEKMNSKDTGPKVSTSYSYRKPEIMGCYGGRRWMWVSPNGELLPCFHTPLSFGNYRENSLSEVWKKMGSHHLFKRKKCTWKDSEYRENYYPCIQKAVKEDSQPCSISEAEKLE